MSDVVPITGTLIWYYAICRREVWLMGHQVDPDQEDDNIAIGRFIHENSYRRDRHEVSVENVKIDVVQGQGHQYVVGEIKKSSRAAHSARLQLLYYLYVLKDKGLEMNGRLLYPEEKRVEEVVLDDEAIKEVEAAVAGIRTILDQPLPPPPLRTRWCTKCAYGEFCWA